MVRIIPSNYNEYSGYDRVSNTSWRKDRKWTAGMRVQNVLNRSPPLAGGRRQISFHRCVRGCLYEVR